MTPYYKEKFKAGTLYQKFVSERLGLSDCEDVLEQYFIGENYEGIEIKYDMRFEDTRNLYIEVAEKTRPSNREYIPSGIFRDDNTQFYLIGNFEKAFLFLRARLQEIYRERKYRIIEIGIKTSKGFLLPEKDINKYCLKTIVFE